MAGYPYTGGMYGGYSDADNNKKKTFIGPKADKAIASGARAMLNQQPPVSTVAEAGMQSGSLIDKTAKGYPNIGLSTPPSIPSQKREVDLNIPMQAVGGSEARSAVTGTPATVSLPLYAMSSTGGIENTGPTGPLGTISTGAMRYGRELVTPNNTLTSAAPKALIAQGNTYTTGQQGQDGYGRISVLSGNGGNSSARNLLSASPVQKTTERGGFSFTGSVEDASRFFDPKLGKMPTTTPEFQNEARARDYQKANPFDTRNPYDDRFSYVKPEGSSSPLVAPPSRVDSGGGWKSRRGDAQVNAAMYGDYARAATAASNSANQMKAENQRNALNYMNSQAANELARQRLFGEQQLNDARIASEGINQQKGQTEVDALNRLKAAQDAYAKDPSPQNEAILRGLTGKWEREAQYGTVGRYDDMGNKIGEDIYSKGTGELKGSGDSAKEAVDLPPIPERVKGKLYRSPKTGQLAIWDGYGLIAQ